MKKENIIATHFVRQLKYVGPIGEASKTYTRLKNEADRLEAGNVDKAKKNSHLESETRELQVRKSTVQNDIAALDRKLREVRHLYVDEKAAFVQLLDKKEKTKEQIKEQESILNELTSENGSIRRQVRKLAEEKTLEILKLNEAVIATCIAASMAVFEQDPANMYAHFFQNPRQPGESPYAFFLRQPAFLREKLCSMFNIFQAELAQMVSNYLAPKEYNSYGISN